MPLLVTAAATLLVGHAVSGAPIRAVRRGDPEAPRTVLVVGDVHGNEPAGRAVVRALRATPPPSGTQVWTVATANPDGESRGTRHNARGVDLNRNFPARWSGGGRPWDTYFPGGAAASEPETRALMRLVRRLRPERTVYYHQHMDAVVLPRAPVAGAFAREYARDTGMRTRRLPAYRGTAVGWQNARDPRSAAIVVELPAGRLDASAARRHARAAVATPAGVPTRAAAVARRAAAPKPRIVWSPIPFGRDRQRQMAAYSQRHYGERTARLTDPKVVVEHITAGPSYASAFNTFASNARDAELGELPGTCAHFVIDTDGTIHQLVSLRWRCRHTVGLNQTAIGIEHVGYRDGDLLGNRRQLRASLALTRWLQARFGIAKRDVIGHNESLSSPYHRERVARLRTQTHGDMTRASMRRYRSRLP